MNNKRNNTSFSVQNITAKAILKNSESHKSVVCNHHRNTDHTATELSQSSYSWRKKHQFDWSDASLKSLQRHQSPAQRQPLSRMIYWIIKPVKSRFRTRFMPIGWRLSISQNNKTMNKCNRTWIAFANKKRCRLTKAINTLVVISWIKLKVYYSILTIPANCTK